MNEILKQMVGKTEEEINDMFDSGMFNDIVLGAIIITMENLADTNSWNKNDIEEVVYECKEGTFDIYSAEQCRQAYKKLK